MTGVQTCALPILTEEFIYEDIVFPKDMLLIIHAPYSGRDPSAFEDPTAILPERDRSNRHLAFGRGAHICLGQHLAKIQISEGIHLMARRIRNPRLAGELEWRPFLGVWGLETLPIEFDPA